MKIPSFNSWRPHPWHGIEVGPNPPRLVNAYIEITTFDLVKYEIDKQTGFLRVDRPQRTSSQPPSLYGFIPQTLCGEKFRRLSPATLRGDGDPLDICVVSERPISKSEIVLVAKVVGGLQMIDHDEADDKIVAVLKSDYVWGGVEDISELPRVLIERLVHYFSTYKMVTGEENRARIANVYGNEHAAKVVDAAREDYIDAFASDLGDLPHPAPAG